MMSGQQAMGRIEQALGDAQRDLAALHDRANEVQQAAAALEQEKLQAYKDLSAFRLGLLDRDDGSLDLSDAEARAQRLLDQRLSAGRDIDKNLEEAQEQLRELESQREPAAARIDAASDAIDAVVEKVQTRLADDPAYMQQWQVAKAAEATIAKAKRKVEIATEDREEKGQPYQQDPIFMYLWNRHYGTSEYRAFVLFRYFDGKLARMCGYDQARPNFRMLLDIPKRLEGYIERAQDTAEAEAAKLVALEEEALEGEGIGELRAELEDAETDFDALMDRIKDALDDTGARLKQRSNFRFGEDDQYRQAMDVLKTAYQKMRPRELLRAAYRTPEPDDDAIIETIEDIERRHQDNVDETLRLQNLRQAQERRIQELETIRSDFHRQRYDSPDSGFDSAGNVALLLGSVLNGALTAAQFSRGIRQQSRRRRRRANPTFGSGGLNLFGGGSRSSGRSIRTGGGFQTGGGFRVSGGGFKTGGGF